MSLHNKHILVGISGGIAAYKSAELVRGLRAQGAEVRVVMTTAAKEFITPLTLQALSGNPVSEDLFDPAAEAAMGHIELARWADAIIIAPATADTIARLTQGRADDLLTTLCLASTAPLYIAPAMNQQMWESASTQSNLRTLQVREVAVLGPASGEQACGEIGPGRMLEPADIVTQLQTSLSQALQGLRIVLTAGPTQEAIDPVRYLTNPSSGKMGYAIAQAAVHHGATVHLISGPVALTPPSKLTITHVRSAQEMHDAVMNAVLDCDVFIACAAVSDYRPSDYVSEKIKKHADTLELVLKKTPDILASVAQLPARPLCVGFAAETQDVIQNAKNKLIKKNIDMIIANDVSVVGQGFQSDDNELTLITREKTLSLTQASKRNLAFELIPLIHQQYQQWKNNNEKTTCSTENIK